MAPNDLENFIREFADSIAAGTFVKATVGNYKGPEEQLQRILVRPVETKRGQFIQFVSSFKTKEEAENLAIADAAERLALLFERGFRAGHLFTTANDLQLAISKKGRAKLSRSAPTFREPPDTSHDRIKRTAVDPSSRYLHLLGITTADGTVRDKKQAKFRQISRFVSILDDLISEAGLSDSETIRVVDMGCGKGYLTFALYDHLAHGLRLTSQVTGIEERPDLVGICTKIADECGFGGLQFNQGRIGETDPGAPDILIALHACDTATDDAIFSGIKCGSKVIVIAPCCQKELRSQLRFPEQASGLNDFGLLLERETESVTDGIRALLLGDSGYKVKMLEFVAPEHTPKNNMIAAVRKTGHVQSETALGQADSLMKLYGVSSQRLHSLLAGRTS